MLYRLCNQPFLDPPHRPFLPHLPSPNPWAETMKQLNTPDNNVNLHKLLSLTRPDVLGRFTVCCSCICQYFVKTPCMLTGIFFTLASIIQKSRNEAKLKKKSPLNRQRQQPLQRGRTKDRDGFMTCHHKGRCSLDPKLIPARTPGPGYIADNSTTRKKLKGASFGKSTSKRGTEVDPPKRHRGGKRSVPTSGFGLDSTSIAGRSLMRCTSSQGTMISSGNRYSPLHWQSTDMNISAHAGAHDGSGEFDRSRCSPGPRYGGENRTLKKVDVGAKFSTSTKFKPGQNSFVPASSSPGPVYSPSVSQTHMRRPYTAMESGSVRDLFDQHLAGNPNTLAGTSRCGSSRSFAFIVLCLFVVCLRSPSQHCYICNTAPGQCTMWEA